MKRIVLFAAAAVILSPAMASAQATVDEILSAAPPRARDATTVIKWNADYSYETIKEGDGPLACYDRSDEPGRAAFAVQCTSKANLDRVAQNRRFQIEGNGERPAVQALVAAAAEDGSRIMPEFGSAFISLNGPDAASAGRHMTIAVPMATTASMGLPDNPRQGGAWIMAAGTQNAHVMTPGGGR